MSFKEKGDAVVPSWPRTTVKVSPERAVQIHISYREGVDTLFNVTLKPCPVEGLGKREPVPEATVIDVAVLVMDDASVVFALLAKSVIMSIP